MYIKILLCSPNSSQKGTPRDMRITEVPSNAICFTPECKVLQVFLKMDFIYVTQTMGSELIIGKTLDNLSLEIGEY